MLFSQEYVLQYKQNIELQATEYVKHGMWTLSQAYNYIDRLVNTIFGTDKHSGIVDFLVSQKHLNLTPEDLISHAQQYVHLGWHVAQMGTKYYLLSGEFKRVADVTGPSSIVPGSAILEITPENAYMMFETPIAQKIVTIAGEKGISPEEIRQASYMQQFFTENINGNEDIYGYVQNYYNLFKVLEKFTYYKGSVSDSVDIRELYALGYRISNLKNPTSEPRAYLQKGSDIVVIRPVQRDKSAQGINNDLVNLIGTKLQEQLLSQYGVMTDVPTEINELSVTFALGFKQDNFSFNNLDYFETERMLKVIDTQGQSKLYPAKNYKRISDAVAALAVTRILLLGDAVFNPGSLSIDTVNNKVYSKYTGTLFTTDIQSLKMYHSNTQTQQSVESKSSLRYVAEDELSIVGKNWNVITAMCALLPDGFVDSVQNINLDEFAAGTSEDISQLSNYFEIAKQTLLRAVGK